MAQSKNLPSVPHLLPHLVPSAQSLARPPISNYHVGTVGLGSDGRVFVGVNLEFPASPSTTPSTPSSSSSPTSPSTAAPASSQSPSPPPLRPLPLVLSGSPPLLLPLNPHHRRKS
ncbi:cytidine deaminase 1 [Phtheirospermum japonicum]|uniref:Cytidine deaminase 1 n=1 Tax=Phtheirospermum japonicum TaxID=374723 RepID=A0A830CJW9_9LAMI|nr:cytidine deaminase 1 [Phtheirospermum japonicum]